MSNCALSRGRAVLAVALLHSATALGQSPPSVTVTDPDAAATPAPPANGTELDRAGDFDALEAALASDSGTNAPGTPPPPPPRGGGAWVLTPELSATLDLAAAFFSDDEPLQSGHHDPSRTGFNWQGLELTVGGSVDPYLRLDTNIGFSPEGVELEEAYVTTLALPAGLQVRLGQFLTRFGRLNATHLHAWNFADQPFELGRLFGGEGARGLGAEASVLLPVPWSVVFVASTTGTVTHAAHDDTEAAAEEPAAAFPNDLSTTLALEQFFALSADWSLAVGLSTQLGPYAQEEEGQEIWGGDAYLKYRPLGVPEPRVVSVLSEWFLRQREPAGQALLDYGSFTELAWRFARRWSTAARYEIGSPSFDTEARIQLDPAAPEWTRTRHRWGTAVSFYPSEFSRFRWQWGQDVPRFREPIWSMFLTAEVTVGAHAAHTF